MFIKILGQSALSVGNAMEWNWAMATKKSLKRQVLLGLALTGAVFVPGPASADAVQASAPLQGQCMGIQSAQYASVSKTNSTGVAVSLQAGARLRAAFVVSYHADCPKPS